MNVAFLVTAPYQVFHYKWIAKHFNSKTVIVEVRDNDFGVSEAFLTEHMQNCQIEWVPQKNLTDLDGRFDVIVCQTPILPHKFFKETLVVAQQYSLAKEVYQYGTWRTHAHLNLMYGPYSVNKVSNFANAVAVGNPLLDPLFSEANLVSKTERSKPQVLYMPTYGELSSLRQVIPHLGKFDCDFTIKLHHGEFSVVSDIPKNCEIVYSDSDPIQLLRNTDFVMSDFSGSAFDALYAQRPLIIVNGIDNPAGKDYRRLSEDEINRRQITNLSSTWIPGYPLEQSLKEAETKLGDIQAYTKFINEMFVNPGAAGEACANEIIKLVEVGEPVNFGRMQIRNTLKDYIESNRSLKSQLQKTKKVTGSFAYKFSKKTFSLYSKLSPFVPNSVPRRLGGKAKKKMSKILPTQLPTYSSQGYEYGFTASQRREFMLNCIEERFKEQKIKYAITKTEEEQSICAVKFSDKMSVYNILKTLAETYTDLDIKLGKNDKVKSSVAVKKLRYQEFFEAHWVRTGIPVKINSVSLREFGYISIEFLKESIGKYLTSSMYSEKSDWTLEFKERPSSHVTAVKSNMVDVGPIDVVYTWVDSSDDAWRKSKLIYTPEDEKLISADNAERYENRNELKYSIRSLLMFAPFVRNIYIVTANQKPSWLDVDNHKVKIVPHSDIFPERAALPTFNSHAIEACLHRIPGLSENFLYFNDDVFLGREITKEDFFTKSGLLKVQFSPTQIIYEGVPKDNDIPTHWAAYNANQLISRDFGITFNRKLKHVPFILNKAVLQEIDDRYPQEIRRTRLSRVRSSTDLSVPSMFANFYAIATGRGVEWPNKPGEYIYADTGKSDLTVRINKIISRQPKFFCLNATKHREIDLEDQNKILASFLEALYPIPAPFEL